MAKQIKYTTEQLLALLERIEQNKLEKTDFALISNCLHSMKLFSQALKSKNTTMHHIREIFGFEATHNLPHKSDENTSI